MARGRGGCGRSSGEVQAWPACRRTARSRHKSECHSDAGPRRPRLTGCPHPHAQRQGSAAGSLCRSR